MLSALTPSAAVVDYPRFGNYQKTQLHSSGSKSTSSPRGGFREPLPNPQPLLIRYSRYPFRLRRLAWAHYSLQRTVAIELFAECCGFADHGRCTKLPPRAGTVFRGWVLSGAIFPSSGISHLMVRVSAGCSDHGRDRQQQWACAVHSRRVWYVYSLRGRASLFRSILPCCYPLRRRVRGHHRHGATYLSVVVSLRSPARLPQHCCFCTSRQHWFPLTFPHSYL